MGEAVSALNLEQWEPDVLEMSACSTGRARDRNILPSAECCGVYVQAVHAHARPRTCSVQSARWTQDQTRRRRAAAIRKQFSCDGVRLARAHLSEEVLQVHRAVIRHLLGGLDRAEDFEEKRLGHRWRDVVGLVRLVGHDPGGLLGRVEDQGTP